MLNIHKGVLLGITRKKMELDKVKEVSDCQTKVDKCRVQKINKK